MLAKDINFKKGMEFIINKKSQYDEQYNETLNCKVIGIRNYKSRGQKIQLHETRLGYGFSIWKMNLNTTSHYKKGDRPDESNKQRKRVKT